MVRALAAQNGESESLALLAKPGTVAVVTGQQVGLFSGPAYTIYKALTAARLARKLTESGTPAVPIFWLATEDHDFAEVSKSWVFDAGQSPVELDIAAVDAAPAGENGRQRPVGGIEIKNPPIDQLRRALAGFAHADEVMAAVENAYRPGVTMGEGFRRLLASLMGQLGLIFLDPLDPAIRKISVPLVSEALGAAPELKARLLERSQELMTAGYHAQVHLEAKTSLFFLLENGERVPLRRKDSEFADLRDRAADVSPNALLRPVVQDYLLPTVAYVGGPAELAYLAQSAVLYDRLLGRMPVAMSRAGFTLLEPRTRKLLERYGLTLPQIFDHPDTLKDRIAHTLVPDSVEQAFADTAAKVADQIERLRAELERFDPTLAAAFDKSRAKMVYQLEKSRRKAARETMRRDDRAQADASYLIGLLYPHRHLQERFYSILPFLAKHGLDLVDQLYDAVQLDCPDHRVFQI